MVYIKFGHGNTFIFHSRKTLDHKSTAIDDTGVIIFAFLTILYLTK